MTEDEIPEEMINECRKNAMAMCALLVANLQPAAAFIAVCMTAAFVIQNFVLVEGVTDEELLDDLRDSVADFLKDMREAETAQTAQ